MPGLRGFNYQAADARPYALGTLVGALSVYCLIRWLDTARWQDAALFAAAAAVLWRVQLVYWPFYAVLAAYTVARLVRKDTAVTGLHAAGVFAAIGVLLAPAAVSALALFRQAGAHVIVARPGKSELWRSLKAGLIALCAGAAWLWARIGKSTTAARTPIAASSWVLIAAWWLFPPLGLFAFSWITGSSVFVDRYLSLSLPGAALAATAGAAVFLNAFLDVRRWRIATVLLGSGVLLFLGQWRSVWPPHHNSDWRAAAHAASLAAGPDVPVSDPQPVHRSQSPGMVAILPRCPVFSTRIWPSTPLRENRCCCRIRAGSKVWTPPLSLTAAASSSTAPTAACARCAPGFSPNRNSPAGGSGASAISAMWKQLPGTRLISAILIL